MMNIEDLIVTLGLTCHSSLNVWDTKLVYSFTDQISQGSGFTEKQANLALKIIGRHEQALSSVIKQNVGTILKNPTYRYPFRTINSNKKISIQSHSLLGRSIKLEFPFNETYVASIRSNKSNLEFAQWDKDEKAWFLSLTENSIKFLLEMLTTEKFDYDEEFQNLLNQFNLVTENIDQYIPMLILEDGRPKFKNIPDQISELSTDDILAALFEARRKAILTWSDEINEWIDNSTLKKCTKEFLKTDPGDAIHLNSENTPINDISDIIKYMAPCLVVVPGGSELEKLNLIYEFLKTENIKNKDISVMFRLPSENDKKFNDFVKENELNSPIGENTKVVFISSKLPKPVLKSNIRFNSVINLGFGGVHFSIKEYAGNHENQIFYTEKSVKRN